MYSKEYNTGPLTAGAEVKKRRDPNAPKAVCNAYMVFCRLERARVKQENPELPFGQIGAKLGEVWRNMSADEKQPYEDRAGVDRERYRREMEQYTHGLKSEKRQRTKMEQSAGSAKKNQPKQQQRQEYDEDQYDDDEGEEY